MILETWLGELPRDRSVALLLRHAERAPIEKIADAMEARLTAQGREDSRRLGEEFAPWSPLVIHHSFIHRCRETAEAVAAGARAKGAAVEVRGVLDTLGGPYLRDWDGVMRRVIAEGAGAFVRDWFAGRLASDQVVEPLQAAREQLSVPLGQLAGAGEKALIVNVTHDWNVLLVRHFFLDSGRAGQRWPDYLEAVAAWREGDVVYLQQGARRQALTE